MTRRILLIVAALLFAAPAFATVDVNALQNDPNKKVVSIVYNCTAGEDVRAFALDVSVDNSTTITGISSFFSGEGAGYGIFPGSFRDNIDAADPNWVDPAYTPVAPTGDPGAQAGLGTSAVTIELGSLYVAPNAPPASGTLCKLALSTASSDCNMTLTANATRGNIVLEDATEAADNLPLVRKLLFDCYTGTDIAGWTTMGKPACWCASYHCYGDADLKTSGAPFNYRIFTGDMGKITSNWKRKITDTALDPCADVDHKSSGAPFNYRVFTGDMGKVTSNWKKKDSNFTALCGPGLW